MVKLLLSIKAELENVTNLEPRDADFDFFFEVKCTSCHETHPKPVTLNRRESFDLSGGKGGTANFVWRCGNCKRESSAKFEDAYAVRAYSAENEQFGPLLQIECRGLEFISFDPRGIWKCQGMKGTVFSEVDLDEGEWTDYDEKAALPVGVSSFESQWTRA
ncbi:hypothetical protein MIND_00477000 [Mycena indigotica]|uniref:DUF866-domain-containing protein n=1 Tax=Mycena indigotica TaxID=2126181 RepID=A0A8H6SX23_9AGAR|nr:uncharacterized protein MIND_00477000 [Mycena indigotica]KAF7306848.1 hypothetical protein MIND_00477000 [Mycena indigotica]